MRVVLQRVLRAAVAVGDETVAEIGPGLVALVGIARGDADADADRLADKTVRARLFAGGERPFDRALTELPGPELLCVSQFTLIGDLRRGNRPSWADAARPEDAEPLVSRYADRVASHGVRVARGRFGATMEVRLVNDGPVTIALDSREMGRPRSGGGAAPGERLLS